MVDDVRVLSNVLVHEYVKVDDDVVLTRLNDPDDLNLFAQQIAAWLAG